VNGSSPQFYLSTISLTDLNATSCASKTLTINAYGDTAATPLNIASASNTAYSYATFAVATTGAMTASPGTAVTVVSGQNSTTAAFDLGFASPQATSGAVYKLTLQSN
jgi:hypothetical protein